MGTRLYPRTNNPAILELLAGVPTGTNERLRLKLKRYNTLMSCIGYTADDNAFLRHERLKFRCYKEIRRDDHLGRLDSFLTFGWGKVRSAVYDLLEKHPDMLDDSEDIYCNSCEDTGFCKDILARQGVTLPVDFDAAKLEGLSWG